MQYVLFTFGNGTSFVIVPVVFLSDEASAHEVLVGVLSARHHHDLRQAIRDTWSGYLREHPLFQNRYVCGISGV